MCQHLQVIKDLIKRILKACGLSLHWRKSLPRGLNFFDDLKRAYPAYPLNYIIDIGANTGQMRGKLQGHSFQHLYCFEPQSQNFANLSHNLAGDQRITCLKLAVDSECGEMPIYLNQDPSMHSLLKPASITVPSEMVPTITLDSFIAGCGKERFSLVKVDAEGAELRILEGARESLSRAVIDFLQLELSFSPDNCDHISFEQACDFLYVYGYRVFAIYEQTAEWKTESINLRRADVVFASDKVIRLAKAGR